MTTTIADLKQIDENAKPHGSEQEWKLAHEFFDDCSRSTTISINESLGVGIGDNPYPIELNVYKRVVSRLATVYRAPASRWLLTEAGRLNDSDPAQVSLTELFRRMRYDLAWRKIDRLRTLFRQVVVRYYPSDSRRCPVPRVFEPYNVIREPAGHDADVLSQDRQFALRISLEPEMWEHWTRDSATGLWQMSIVSEQGERFEARDLQFAESAGFSPYGLLPAMLVYDEDPLGHPWLAPRAGRSALQVAINAKANDLWALVRNQAHDDRFWATDDPELLPDVSGPGVEAAVPKDARLIEASSPGAKIEESEQILRTMIKMWLMSEGIPSADLDESKTILTGAALRIQERELREKREEQAELAHSDEALAWSIVRAINNTHSAEWGSYAFDESSELDIELADVEAVSEPRQDQAFWHSEVKGGYASAIDWIRRRDNVPRHQAIRTWSRTQKDLATYATLELEAELAGNRVGNPGGERDIDPENDKSKVISIG